MLKKHIQFIIPYFILICSMSASAQLSGKIYQDGYPYPMVKIYFEDVKPKASSNFEGEFKLRIPNDTLPNNIIINFSNMKLRILNCPLEVAEKLDIGTLILPKYKQLTVEEYKERRRKVRKKCLPLYNGDAIIGYLSKTELESDSLSLRCPEGEGVSSFSFDPKTKTISMEWTDFINCN